MTFHRTLLRSRGPSITISKKSLLHLVLILFAVLLLTHQNNAAQFLISNSKLQRNNFVSNLQTPSKSSLEDTRILSVKQQLDQLTQELEKLRNITSKFEVGQLGTQENGFENNQNLKNTDSEEEPEITGESMKNIHLRKMYIWIIIVFVVILVLTQAIDLILYVVLLVLKLGLFLLTLVLEFLAQIIAKITKWKQPHNLCKKFSKWTDDMGFEEYAKVHAAFQNNILEYPILAVSLALLALFGLSYYDTNLQIVVQARVALTVIITGWTGKMTINHLTWNHFEHKKIAERFEIIASAIIAIVSHILWVSDFLIPENKGHIRNQSSDPKSPDYVPYYKYVQNNNLTNIINLVQNGVHFLFVIVVLLATAWAQYMYKDENLARQYMKFHKYLGAKFDEFKSRTKKDCRIEQYRYKEINVAEDVLKCRKDWFNAKGRYTSDHTLMAYQHINYMEKELILLRDDDQLVAVAQLQELLNQAIRFDHDKIIGHEASLRIIDEYQSYITRCVSFYLSEPLPQWRAIYRGHDIDEGKLYNSVLNIFMNNFTGHGQSSIMITLQAYLFGAFLRYAQSYRLYVQLFEDKSVQGGEQLGGQNGLRPKFNFEPFTSGSHLHLASSCNQLKVGFASEKLSQLNNDQVIYISKVLDIIMDTVSENYAHKSHELNLITILMQVNYEDFYNKHVQKILDYQFLLFELINKQQLIQYQILHNQEPDFSKWKAIIQEHGIHPDLSQRLLQLTVLLVNQKTQFYGRFSHIQSTDPTGMKNTKGVKHIIPLYPRPLQEFEKQSILVLSPYETLKIYQYTYIASYSIVYRFQIISAICLIPITVLKFTAIFAKPQNAFRSIIHYIPTLCQLVQSWMAIITIQEDQIPKNMDRFFYSYFVQKNELDIFKFSTMWFLYFVVVFLTSIDAILLILLRSQIENHFY